MYEDNRDPTQCAIFYLAMRKKRLWQNMWKMAAHHPEQPAMIKFLANDFEEPRWRAAALKNAFALLGKQRYGKEASFVLLIQANVTTRVCNCFLSSRRSPGGCNNSLSKATERLSASYRNHPLI